MSSTSSSPDQTAVRASGPVLDVVLYDVSGGLDEALAKHADEAFYELDVPQRAVAESIFKRLTELGDDGRQIRRPCALQELADAANVDRDAVRHVIDHFGSRGRSFLTTSVDGVVDISHESLIRQWPRLSQWSKEEADSRQTYARLADAAGREAALLRNPDLLIATRWFEESQPTKAWAGRYDGDFGASMAYLNSSQAAEGKRRKALIAAGIVLAALAVAFGILALWATGKQSEANDQTERANISAADAASQTEKAELQTEIAEQAQRDAEGSAAAAAQAQTQAEQAAEDAVEAQEAADTERDRATAQALAAEARATRFQNPALALTLAVEAPTTSELANSSARTALVESMVAFAAQQFQPVGPAIQADRTVNAVAFVRNGELVASGGAEGRVRLWDPSTSQEVEIEAPLIGSAIRSLVYSDQEQLLAAGSTNGAIWLWDAGSPDGTWRNFAKHGDKTSVTALAFGADGVLYSGGSDNMIHRWSLDNGGDPTRTIDLEIRNDKDKPFAVNGLAHIGDGVLVAAWANGDFRIIYPDDAGKEPLVLRQSDDDLVGKVSLAFHDDGTLATAAIPQIQLWDLNEATPVDITPDSLTALVDPVSTLAFGPHGRLAIANEGGDVVIWHNESNEIERLVDSSRGRRVDSMVFNSSGRLASGARDGTVRFSELRTSDPLPQKTEEYGHLRGLVVNQNSGQLATLGDGKLDENFDGLWLWDENGQSPTNVTPGLLIRGVAFSPTSDEIAYLERLPADDPKDPRVGKVWVRDLSSGATREALLEDVSDRSGDHADVISFSSTGLVAAVWNSKSFHVWDTNAGDLGQPMVVEAHDGFIEDIAFSPDGELVVTAGRDAFVKVWNAADGALVTQLDTTTEAKTLSLAFSQDGSSLVAAKNDGRILLWDTNALDADPRVLRASQGIRDVGFSPDGQLLATVAREDGTLLLWELENGLPVTQPLEGPSGISNTVAFSADGSSIMATGEGGLVAWQDLLSESTACELAAPYVRATQLRQFLGDNDLITGCSLR